jgi:hypothetical protein
LIRLADILRAAFLTHQPDRDGPPLRPAASSYLACRNRQKAIAQLRFHVAEHKAFWEAARAEAINHAINRVGAERSQRLEAAEPQIELLRVENARLRSVIERARAVPVTIPAGEEERAGQWLTTSAPSSPSCRSDGGSPDSYVPLLGALTCSGVVHDYKDEDR